MEKKPRHAGSGFILMLVSQVVFLLSGFALSVGLGRLLGPEMFGVVGVVMGGLLIIFNIQKSTFQQSVTKFTSEDPDLVESVKRKSLKWSFVISLVVAGLVFVFADLLALLFRDPSLGFYFRLGCPVIIFAGLFGVYLGYYAGTRKYKKLMFLPIVNSVLRTGLALLLVWLGYAIGGVMVGLGVAILITIIVGFFMTKKRDVVGVFKIKKMWDYAKYIFVFILLIMLLQNLGLYFVKALMPVDVASLNAGYFNAAFSLSNVLYLICSALCLALFPLISNSDFRKDIKKLRSYIKNGMRYTLLILVPFVVLTATNAKEILNLIYGVEYAPAAGILFILCFTLFVYSLFYLTSTIISGTGNAKRITKVTGIVLILNVMLNFLLIPKYGAEGAAIGALIALVIGFLINAKYIYGKYKSFVSWLLVVKLVVVSGIVYLISMYTPYEGIYLIIKYALLLVVYVGLLFVFREIKFIDIKRIKDSIKQL
jgi:stage V sporulation protein B